MTPIEKQEYFKNSLLKDFEYLISNYGFKFIDFPMCLDYEYPEGDHITIHVFSFPRDEEKVYYYVEYYSNENEPIIRSNRLLNAKEIIDYIEM
jgi:hypothetical protein